MSLLYNVSMKLTKNKQTKNPQKTKYQIATCFPMIEVLKEKSAKTKASKLTDTYQQL